MSIRTGGCLCGEVRFSFEGEFRVVTHCHCQRCRRHHGAAFASHGALERGRLAIEDPTGALRHYEGSGTATRSFCGLCGSSLFWRSVRHEGYVDVALGALDDATWVKPMAHIHVASKAPWYEIKDDLRQFDGDPTWSKQT